VGLEHLDHPECERGNAVPTRNARLTAVRSFFHHVAASDAASIGIAQRILAIPIKVDLEPTAPPSPENI
jgi:hypothetical protein